MQANQLLPRVVFSNPNGIQIHQPRVGGPTRTGGERLPWESGPKFIIVEGVAASGLFDALLLFLLDRPVRRPRDRLLLLFDRAVAFHVFRFGVRNGAVTARGQK